MKRRYIDILVYDMIDDFCVSACTVKSVREAERIISALKVLGIDAVYGLRRDCFVDGKCVYDED